MIPPVPSDDRLECWDPKSQDSLRDSEVPKCPLEAERDQTGLCGEAQSDGVPCTDPTRRCEICGRAHR